MPLTNENDTEANDLLEQIFFKDNDQTGQDPFHEIPPQYIDEHFQAINIPPCIDEETYPPLPDSG